MSQQVNSPTVIGVLLTLVVMVVILTFATIAILAAVDRRRDRRRDNRIFKAVEEARRDFS